MLLIEWPERGAGWLPLPDLDVKLSYCLQGRRAFIERASRELPPLDHL
jgi:tRNA A37 threonylcarbamoyladenosine biosynthesis protein TsaE